MNEVVHTSPTIGSNVEEVVWNNIHFIMWDLGGQESLRTSWNTYYSNTEVCVTVLSLFIPKLFFFVNYLIERGYFVIEKGLNRRAKKLKVLST